MSGRVMLLTFCALAACSVTPQSHTPLALGDAPLRHATVTQTAAIPDGAWPALFADPLLVSLIDAALANNYEIASANARIAQARALVMASDAYQTPTVGINPSLSRNRVSGTVDDALPKRMLRTWALPVDATYEVDLWGRLKGQADVAREDALAAQADAAAVRLRVSTEVASDYLTLRFVEQDSAELRQAIQLRQAALRLVQRRVKAGAASDLDALRAATEMNTANADLAESERERDNLVDALAVLTGRSVNDLTIGPGLAPIALPDIPVGLPSALLEQRPDIYAAQRRLDAASLQIGIARTAYLPTLTLTADGGFASRDLSSFLDRNSSVWGLAISAALTLIDGDRRRAVVESAQAGYMIADANSKALMLDALRQVQDALNDVAAQRLRIAAYEQAASTSAQAARLSRSRYEHGYVDYFEVVDSDREALSIQRELIHSRQAQAVATVTLVRTIGGGWTPISGARPGMEKAARSD
ncbi:RND transporter [Paraburkholderia phytofirmans OLGA172]|uniref:RND transporter n=1 Tax=Paraburkholderia phytofirmans OLGA172 TaxID=1417228 RepID=A0A160FTS0_9BURK|nr:efflux transporter outer membrane subunit [Paraburkholderia phytofirmans]ANB76431.1 RND transporter [Paraburkholderia phytofirmans OLGA172]